ncbi:MAG: stage V sporulation protein AD [Bacillota bacterium]
MTLKRMGRQTLYLPTAPIIYQAAAVVGPVEGKGPLKDHYDEILPDALIGQKSWEKAESAIIKRAVQIVLQKAGLEQKDVSFLLAGDLLNQIAASNFAARDINIPYIGLYGACSTMAQAMAVAAVFVDGGYAQCALAAASSHFDSAERQYRYPLEFGCQRPPTTQRTVTGAGAVLLTGGSGDISAVRVTHVTFGMVMDLGMKDPNHMGAAMAPAAAHTISQHLSDTGQEPSDYDLIITGDLGVYGLELCKKLLLDSGLELADNLDDCGIRIYDRNAQDVHAGGSGCACSAVTFAGQLMHELTAGRLGRLLLVSTGALFSPTTQQQGESIPGIAHAVAIQGPAAGGGG